MWMGGQGDEGMQGNVECRMMESNGVTWVMWTREQCRTWGGHWDVEDTGVHVRHNELRGCVRDIWGDMEKSKGGVWLTRTLLNPTGSTAARRLCDTPGAGGCCGCRMGEAGDGLPCPAPRCPFDCSDQGRCRAGRCHCFEGFTGPFCATPICPSGRGGPHCSLGMSPSLLLPWHLVLMPLPSILVCPPVSSAVLQCSPSVPIPVLSVVPDPSSALSVLVFPWLGHFCSLETPSVSPYCLHPFDLLFCDVLRVSPRCGCLIL